MSNFVPFIILTFTYSKKVWTCNTKANQWTACYSPNFITPTSRVYARYDIYEPGTAAGESNCKCMNVFAGELTWVDLYKQEAGHFVGNPYWYAQGVYYKAQITCYTTTAKSIQWSFYY